MKKFTMGKAVKVLGMTALAAGISMANAADTIKVGVLHSLSGTMAISETTLKDTVLMMVEEQNAKGGLLGKKGRTSDRSVLQSLAEQIYGIQKSSNRRSHPLFLFRAIHGLFQQTVAS